MEGGKFKKGSLSHFIEKSKKKKEFFKKLKVAGIKYGEKSENKLSQEEKVA